MQDELTQAFVEDAARTAMAERTDTHIQSPWKAFNRIGPGKRGVNSGYYQNRSKYTPGACSHQRENTRRLSHIKG